MESIPSLSELAALENDASDLLTPDGIAPFKAEFNEAVKEASAEEFISQSTIDNPPAEVPEVKETEFQKPRASDLYKGERTFEVEFSVVLKPMNGKPIKVPLFADTVRGTLVVECLAQALTEERNAQIIEAILDNPQERVVDEAALPKQGELF